MAWKTRYWVCHECSRVYHRQKGDTERWCPSCQQPMVAARKYPMSLWNRRQRQEDKEKKEQAKVEKHHRVPRTCYGYRLRISAKTRRAWQELAKTQQRRSFVKRANLFMQAFRDDVWTCPHGKGYREHRDCKCTGGGMVRPPEVVLMEGSGFTLGQYQRGILQGKYHISILWKGDHKLATFIHELGHYVDDMAKVPEKTGVGSHSRLFYARIQDIARQLKWNAKEGDLR